MAVFFILSPKCLELIEDDDSSWEGEPLTPLCQGNNPKTAVLEYLKTHAEFEVDKSIQRKLLITVAPGGYLKRVR